MTPAALHSFSDELEKLAKLTTPLLPHQQRVVERMQQEDQPGLVVAHGLGSGKTLTSIAVQDALGVPASVVVPAALKENYLKELKKHTAGKAPKVDLTTLQMATRRGSAPSAPLLTVDEAHRLREMRQGYQAIKKTDADKVLLLTGSPFYNRPSDIAPLINTAAGSSVLPADRYDFANRYVQEREVKPGFFASLGGAKGGTVEELNPSRAGELKQIFGKWVDYHPSSSENFPSVSRETVPVGMSEHQQNMYDTVIGKAPPWVAQKILSGMPPTKQESEQLNAYLAAVRQISNSTAPYQTTGEAHSPKIDRAFEELQKHLKDNPRGKAVIYSNFLAGGIEPYRQRLEKAGIPHGMFTGEMSKKQRDELVRQYNDDKIKVLMLSSAGGEGLDLKGTRLIQMLEPHWNNEKLKQVEGRGIRYKSHEHLPEEERHVHVQQFHATRSPKGLLEKLNLRKPGQAVDEWLHHRSAEKEHLLEQFINLLPKEKAESSRRKS